MGGGAWYGYFAPKSFAVNTNGPFIRSGGAVAGMGGYQAGSLRIRVLQLLHELGSTTITGTGFTSNGYPKAIKKRDLLRAGLLLEVDADNNPLTSSVSNTNKVLKHCRSEIDALPKEMSLSKSVSFFLITVVLGASLSSQLYSQKAIEIGGYLVDANDKPLKNGRITIFYDPPLPVVSFEQLTQFWSPLGDGFFGIDVTWYSGRKIIVLVEDRPEGFYPIENQSVLTNKKIFKGVIISKFSKRRNLQRVRNYIKYGQAVVDIRNCSTLFVEKILKHQIFLKIRTQDGAVVANTSFKPAYDKQSKRLIFNLPEATWYLEFIDESLGKTIMPSTRVVITQSAAEIQFNDTF